MCTSHQLHAADTSIERMHGSAVVATERDHRMTTLRHLLILACRSGPRTSGPAHQAIARLRRTGEISTIEVYPFPASESPHWGHKHVSPAPVLAARHVGERQVGPSEWGPAGSQDPPGTGSMKGRQSVHSHRQRSSGLVRGALQADRVRMTHLRQVEGRRWLAAGVGGIACECAFSVKNSILCTRQDAAFLVGSYALHPICS